MAVLDDLEQVAPVLGAELGQPPVVDDQDLGLGERGEQLGIASVGACDGQFGQEPWQSSILDSIPSEESETERGVADSAFGGHGVICRRSADSPPGGTPAERSDAGATMAE